MFTGARCYDPGDRRGIGARTVSSDGRPRGRSAVSSSVPDPAPWPEWTDAAPARSCSECLRWRPRRDAGQQSSIQVRLCTVHSVAPAGSPTAIRCRR